jgi:Protein of unknown function (DUF2934)
MNDREQQIRERAHQIWEEEGRPQGREREHWERAAREIDAREAGGEAKPTRSGTDEIAGSVGAASGLQPGGTKTDGGPGTGADRVGTGGGNTAGEPTGSPKRKSRT